MARFVIADISDAKSVLQELRPIVPDLPSVPVQPIILETQEEPGMFDFYRGRPSFLQVHRYTRACLHSLCPEHGGDEVDDGGEALVGLLVARGNASEGF